MTRGKQFPRRALAVPHRPPALKPCGIRLAFEERDTDFHSMKRIASAVFLLTILFIGPLPAQSPNEKDQLTALIKEVQAQQAVIAANQAKIEAKLEALSETIREARLYSSRSR